MLPDHSSLFFTKILRDANARVFFLHFLLVVIFSLIVHFRRSYRRIFTGESFILTAFFFGEREKKIDSFLK
jgi:hypothetical protein